MMMSAKALGYRPVMFHQMVRCILFFALIMHDPISDILSDEHLVSAKFRHRTYRISIRIYRAIAAFPDILSGPSLVSVSVSRHQPSECPRMSTRRWIGR